MRYTLKLLMLDEKPFKSYQSARAQWRPWVQATFPPDRRICRLPLCRTEPILTGDDSYGLRESGPSLPKIILMWLMWKFEFLPITTHVDISEVDVPLWIEMVKIEEKRLYQASVEGVQLELNVHWRAAIDAVTLQLVFRVHQHAFEEESLLLGGDFCCIVNLPFERFDRDVGPHVDGDLLPGH